MSRHSEIVQESIDVSLDVVKNARKLMLNKEIRRDGDLMKLYQQIEKTSINDIEFLNCILTNKQTKTKITWEQA